jgi:hypothetical protein
MIYFKIQTHLYSSRTWGENWIKADLKLYMKRHYDFSFWLVFAVMRILPSKSVPVFTLSGITQTLKTTLALYLQYDMAIFGRVFGSSEQGDASFCSIYSGKAIDFLADTHLVCWKLHSSSTYNATFTGDEPLGNIQRLEIIRSTSVTHSGSSCVRQMTRNIFWLVIRSSINL